MRFSIGFLMEGKESRNGEIKLFANFQGAICLDPEDQKKVAQIARALKCQWSCEHWEDNGHYMAGSFAGLMMGSPNASATILKRGNGFVLMTDRKETLSDPLLAMCLAIEWLFSVEETLDRDGLYKRD